jgi:uncharacterized protein YebE (UPF0316 family)
MEKFWILWKHFRKKKLKGDTRRRKKRKLINPAVQEPEQKEFLLEILKFSIKEDKFMQKIKLLDTKQFIMQEEFLILD